MNTHHYILLLGSNFLAHKHLSIAIELLQQEFGIHRTSHEMETKAIDMPNDYPFVNKAVCIQTRLEPTELIQKIKEMEKQLGRSDEKTLQGIIPIDIDVILCDKKVLHSDYETKNYVKKLVEEVSI